MPVLICSTKYSGCGFVGENHEFLYRGEHIVLCPSCHEDHTFQLTDENIVSLTNEDNQDEAYKMLHPDKNPHDDDI